MKLDRYKVNVYSEGGFFKPHADSPSGDEMIGTLVLCLPSPHKGGELCVSHDGLEHVFDFSNHSGDKSKIQEDFVSILLLLVCNERMFGRLVFPAA